MPIAGFAAQTRFGFVRQREERRGKVGGKGGNAFAWMSARHFLSWRKCQQRGSAAFESYAATFGIIWRFGWGTSVSAGGSTQMARPPISSSVSVCWLLSHSHS
jgi:hypothetical protein